MPRVRRAALENGLRVVAVELPHTSYVSLRLLVGAGSRDDPREKAGISHFVEHLIFRGTARHPHEAALRAHAASLGMRLNATTAKDWTSIEADVPSENVGGAIQLLAEMITTPTFNGLEVERRVVMEEMNSAYDESDGSLWPFDLFSDSKLWPYNSLGIPVIGEPRTVMNITLEDVKEYLAKHYRAGGMALGIAGAVDLDVVLPQIEKLFAGLPRGLPERSRKAPLFQNGAMHWMDQQWSPRATVRITFPFLAPSPRAHVTAFMTQSLLATDGAGRVHETLRSRTGIAYTGNCMTEIMNDCARHVIFAEVKKEKMPQMVGTVARMLRDLRYRGPTKEELESARLLLLRDARASHDIPEAAAFLFAQATVLDEPPPDEGTEIAPSITMDEIVQHARNVFRTKHALITVAGPRDDDDQRAAWQMFEAALGD